MKDRYGTILLAIALMGLAVGLALAVAGAAGAARIAWAASVLPVLAGLVVEIVRSLRRGEVGLDIVAALSMTAALLVGETLAAAVVALMYSGGTFLEDFAVGRARREMTGLLSRVPRSATRVRDGGLEEVALDAVAPGDRLLIRQGEIVPVDGRIASPTAFVDASALTGESLPVRLAEGAEAMSGGTNAAGPFELVATRRAEESTYAGIVRLVAQAQRSKAPMARLADRWSLGFLAVTLLLAGVAWGASGDPVRAVAVLVVATPCPLILAVPVALVAGVSRAARFGVLVKGAKPLEAMAQVRTMILDKTGTLTDGRPRIVAIETEGDLPQDELLRLAAALDQASTHPVAEAIVTAARARGLVLPLPSDVVERPGEGVAGRVEGRAIVIGGPSLVSGGAEGGSADAAGAVLVGVMVDGLLAGRLVMADPIRDDAAALIGRLRRDGIGRVVLATGDRAEVAERVTRGLGLDAIHAGLGPEQKAEVVRDERTRGPVMMLGDGVNDAPALAIADVGVAMGARGAAASAEAADVVLLVDRLDRIGIGIEIARRTRQIALQSVAVGLGLSGVGMVAAAFGLLAPVQGALLQEGIDVAVVLNALRALLIAPEAAASAGPEPLSSDQREAQA